MDLSKTVGGFETQGLNSQYNNTLNSGFGIPRYGDNMAQGTLHQTFRHLQELRTMRATHTQYMRGRTYAELNARW